MKKYLFIIPLLVLTGCSAKTELERVKAQCESTGGIFIDCASAFAEACSRAENIHDKNVVCVR